MADILSRTKPAVSVCNGQRSLVFLHGMMGGVSNWAASLDYFRKQCRTLPVAFKLYGNDAPQHNLDTLTNYALRQMDRMEIEAAVVFGNSMGGQVALNMALTAPERVIGLVLTGSAGLLERGYTNDTPLRPSRNYIRKRVEEIFYNPIHATDELIDEVYRIFKVNRNKLQIVRLARALKLSNMRDKLPRIRVPVLLIWGREDHVTPLSVAEIFAERLPNARMVVLNGCGHAPNIEEPEIFNQLSQEFLYQIGYE